MLQKPSPQATNNVNEHDTKLAWYRVPVVWIGILLTLLVFIGLVHMSYVSHQSVKNSAEPKAKQPASETKPKGITHFRGMPLQRSESTTTATKDPAPNHE